MRVARIMDFVSEMRAVYSKLIDLSRLFWRLFWRNFFRETFQRLFDFLLISEALVTEAKAERTSALTGWGV